jgi:hypothetical protein
MSCIGGIVVEGIGGSDVFAIGRGTKPRFCAQRTKCQESLITKSQT